MQKINFTKMVAAGNDFVIAKIKNQSFDKLRIDGERSRTIKNLNKLARNICDRKLGIGADGLLILDKSKVADIKMRIFNSNGSEAQMCGNGAMCVAFWAKSIPRLRSGLMVSVVEPSKIVRIETKAGMIESEINGSNVKIKLTDPKDIKLNIPIKINNRLLKVNFINTGVPHTVIFVEGLDGFDVVNIGRQIRYHNRFKPAGTNVDFVELLSSNSLKIRTYERGVEDETLACGTGAVAAGIISNINPSTSLRIDGERSRTINPSINSGLTLSEVEWVKSLNVHTKSGEILKVYFDKIGERFHNVWLEGKPRIVYKGEYYV